LRQLGNRIDQAAFDEKRRAVEELVKAILVQPTLVDGKVIPVVTLTCRFNEPCQSIASFPAVVKDHMPEHAVIAT
jgi:hypothetical protein